MTDGLDCNLNYYRCNNCSLWNYDLDCGVDQTQYTEVYTSPSEIGAMGNIYQSRSWSYISKWVKEPGTMVDIGCGNGRLLYSARNNGWQVP